MIEQQRPNDHGQPSKRYYGMQEQAVPKQIFEL
jgi:hypothetical protein